MRTSHILPNQQRGFSMIEVLVAILIASLGLLGLAGMQARAVNAEFESYQRGQAMVLAADMAERVRMNRAYMGTFKNVSSATAGTGFVGTNGTGKFSLDCASTNHAMLTLCDWDAVLQGAAEQLAANAATKLGAMVGARGCITYDPASELSGVADSGEFTVSVVWQGMTATEAPKIAGTATTFSAGTDLNCGKGLYTDSNGNVNEKTRRGVSIKFRFAKLN